MMVTNCRCSLVREVHLAVGADVNGGSIAHGAQACRANLCQTSLTVESRELGLFYNEITLVILLNYSLITVSRMMAHSESTDSLTLWFGIQVNVLDLSITLGNVARSDGFHVFMERSTHYGLHIFDDDTLAAITLR